MTLKRLLDYLVYMGLSAPLSLLATPVWSQTGVSSDRVSLPEGSGSLEGVGENAELDPNSGSMAYSVAIKPPLGFPSMTPDVGLSYNSAGGSGVVGMGWSVPMASIERMTFRGLPCYTAEDDFADGGSAQLIRLPGTDPPIYRTRYEGGFQRYRWMDAGNGREGYWVVEYPDGRVAYFGATAEGTLVPNARVSGAEGTYRYMLVEIVDLFGHRLRYDYIKDGSISLVNDITYVFTEPNNPTYRIRFTYEMRQQGSYIDYLSDAKSGFDMRLTQRLSRIEMFTRGERIKYYDLTYEDYAASGGITRLRDVQLHGQDGGAYPIHFTFTYSQALGGICSDDTCEMPFVMDMGSIGVNLGTGDATLIDINGDALPDVVDTTQDGPHRFFENELRTDGTHGFAPPTASRMATRSTFQLSTATIQVLDLDGDGFTDIIDAANGQALRSGGAGDWASAMSVSSSGLPSFDGELDDQGGELRTIRFFDYNGDKRIDILRSEGSDGDNQTLIYRNDKDLGFVRDNSVESIGAGFESDRLQLTDMNGDSLLDVVLLNAGGLRYRLNYGWGRWGPWVTISNLPFNDGEIPNVEIEDMNGDALADLVVVVGSEVRYALNRNASEFGATTRLTSSNVTGTIPSREADTTVLYADMNGNGSTDIVWIDSGGHVQYLELFPTRPNLITRIENHIGMVIEVEYRSSVQEMVRDGGPEAWGSRIPFATQVATRMDTWDRLSMQHKIDEYRYHEGYYSGIEKDFRGFQRVELLMNGDANHEEGLTELRYDVGKDDTYHNGLLMRETVWSGGRELTVTETTYGDCPVAEIPAGVEFPIRYVCVLGSRLMEKEGLSADRWVMTETAQEHDGYGNTIRQERLGVTSVGGGACEPCDRPADEFGRPCGAQCLGDELYTETDYVVPGVNTGGRWILRAPWRVRTYGRPGSELVTETLTRYDGEPFVGLPEGQLTQGATTRITEAVRPGSDEVIEVTRRRFDAHGQVVESIDANGAMDSLDHRTLTTYDEDGLRAVRVEKLMVDLNGEPYRMYQETRYDDAFDQAVEMTDWLLVKDGQMDSNRRSTLMVYDEFGRLVGKVSPGGDTFAAPTEVYTYDLAEPASRIMIQRRSRIGGPLDITQVECFDGRGRRFQTRFQADTGAWQASGFEVFDVRDAAVRSYQPYTGETSGCDAAPPEGVLYTERFRDAIGRLTLNLAADAPDFGTASQTRVVYEPLTTIMYDANDNDPDSPHTDTPNTTRVDGLGRSWGSERVLAPDAEPAQVTHGYDELGRVSWTTDAEGNRRRFSRNLLGRIEQIDDPNSGVMSARYDAMGNLLQTEDARGVVILARYDGMNRLVARWDEADPEGTLDEWLYDRDTMCPTEVCTNSEQRLVGTRFRTPEGQTWTRRLSYDVRGRLNMEASDLDGFAFETRFVHDNANRPTVITWPDGQELRYHYDQGSRLTSVEGVLPSIVYDTRSQPAMITRADGSVSTMLWDARMLPRDLLTHGADGAVLQGFRYSRDRQGNLTEVEDLADPAPARPSYAARYEIDAWYRLLVASIGEDDPEDVALSYDDIDNIRSVTSSRGAASALPQGEAAYEGFGPNAMSALGGRAMTYDAEGHMASKADHRYRWDRLDRLAAIEDAQGTVATFVYDVGNVRVAKREPGLSALYPLDGFEVRDGISSLYVVLEGKRIARLQSSALAPQLFTDLAPVGDEDGEINAGDAWASYAQSEGLLETGEALPTEPRQLLRSSVRRLLMREQTFLHHDHLGSITMATAAGEGGDTVVVGQRSFFPSGLVREGWGEVDPYGFTGKELDATGLLHIGARYYDPELGRWLSTDPAFVHGSARNLARPGEYMASYAYVANDFINSFDSSGLDRVVSYTPIYSDQYQASADKDGFVHWGMHSGGQSDQKYRGQKLGKFTTGDVLTIVAHGAIDKGLLSGTGDDKKDFNAKQLVEQLKADGLDPETSKGLVIKLWSCGSGAEYTASDGTIGEPYANQLAKELKTAGFSEITVVGYGGFAFHEGSPGTGITRVVQSHIDDDEKPLPDNVKSAPEDVQIEAVIGAGDSPDITFKSKGSYRFERPLAKFKLLRKHRPKTWKITPSKKSGTTTK